MNPPKPTLDRLLESWNPVPPETSCLEQEVWRGIGRVDERRTRAILVGSLAAACLAALVGMARWRRTQVGRELNVQFAGQYLHLIDPLLEMRTDTLDAELAWIRSDLKLTPEQFVRIKQLHEASLRQMLALNREALRARREFARLEELRRTSGQVDFLAFARLADSQKELEGQCRDSTLRVVRGSASLMTPRQRERYLRYVQPALGSDAVTFGN